MSVMRLTSTPRVNMPTTSDHYDTPKMVLPSPLIRRSRDSQKNPKDVHKSRKQRACEKNQIKKIIKREAAKHVGRADHLKEKHARKRTNKKARKAMKNETSTQHRPGCVTDNVKAIAVNKLPSFQHAGVGHISSGPAPTPTKAAATPFAALTPSLSRKELLIAAINKADRQEANINASKHLPQSVRHAEIVRKLADNKERQRAKTVVRQAQQQQTGSGGYGAITATVNQKSLPRFSVPQPGTSIVNRYRSAAPTFESPSGYTITLGKPIFATASQGGNSSFDLERNIFKDFVHKYPSGRGAVEAHALILTNVVDLTQNQHTEALGPRFSSPIVLGDESNDEDDEPEYSEPFNPAHHPTEYIYFFGNKKEERRPDLATLKAKNKVGIANENDGDVVMSIEEALPTTKTMDMDEHCHQIAFGCNFNELRNLSYSDIDLDDNERAREGSLFDQVDFDEFGNEDVIGRDIMMSENNETDDEHEAAAAPAPGYRPWTNNVFDLTQDRSDMSEIEDDSATTSSPALTQTPSELIDLTQDDSDNDESESNTEDKVEEVSGAPAVVPVCVNIDDSNVAAQPEENSEANHEVHLNLSIDRDLQRAAHAANARPANPLEEILAKDHPMLYFYHHKTQDPVVRNSVEFVRGLRAEHSMLNSECQRHEMELRAMRRMTDRDMEDMIWKVDNKHRLAEGLGSHLLLVETEFRALVAREDLEMKMALQTAMDGVKEAVEDYDEQVAVLDRE